MICKESSSKTMMASIEALRIQEATRYESAEYLGNEAASNVTVETRKTLAEWVLRVTQWCRYEHETAEMALSLLDRFMMTAAATDCLKSKREFQLATVAAIWIASKTCQYVALNPQMFIQLSLNGYSLKDIEGMESKMLHAMDWKVNCPTVFAFIHETVNILPAELIDEAAKKNLFDLAVVQAQWSLVDHGNLGIKKSVLAFAAVSNAIDVLGVRFDLVNFLRHSVLSSYLEDLDSLPQTKKHLAFSSTENGWLSAICQGDTFVSDKHIESPGLHPDSPRSVLQMTTPYF